MIQSIKTNRTVSDPIGKTPKAVRTKKATLGGTVRTKSLKTPFEQDHNTVVGSKKRRTKMKTVASVPDVSSTGGGVSIIGALPTTLGPGMTVLSKTEVNIAGNGLQFPSPNNVGSCIGGNSNKRPASLDLNKPKKQRLMTPSPLVLESPDLQAIKTLNTPDLEKILLSSNLLQTPQPGHVFPTKVGPVTSEQEAFGKGFEEALHSLYNSSKNTQDQIGNTNNNNSHNSNTSINNITVSVTGVTSASNNATSTTAVTGMSGGSFIYTNLESNFSVSIKDEPQNNPVSPPVSPIDMETQEKIKLERKRQRNRVAASKCRKRKLERISKLEDKVKLLKSENIDLGLVVKNLKEHVAQLKQQVIEHIEIGCSIPTIYNGQTLLQGK